MYKDNTNGTRSSKGGVLLKLKEMLKLIKFHDSVITKISNIGENNEIIINIDLCNYNQIWYKEDHDPEIITGKLIFQGVKSLEIKQENPKRILLGTPIDVEIIDSKVFLDQDHIELLEMVLSIDFGIAAVLSIKAKDVIWEQVNN